MIYYIQRIYLNIIARLCLRSLDYAAKRGSAREDKWVLPGPAVQIRVDPRPSAAKSSCGCFSECWLHFDIKTLLPWKLQAIIVLDVCLRYAFKNAGLFRSPFGL